MDPLSPAAALKPYASRARVKQQLGDTLDSSADPLLDALLLSASRAIDQHCSRRFARESLTESVPGDGGQYLMVSRCPVVVITEILYDNTAVIGATIEDADAGLLFLRTGFVTAQAGGWFLGELRQPGLEYLRHQVTYVGGYLLPADDVYSRTLSCAAGDQSYNDTAGGFPLLVAGDQLLAEGFASGANNGWKTVVSRTATKIIVTAGEPLLDEAAPIDSGDVRVLRVCTLPADIQQACVEVVKGLWFARTRDANIASESVGDLSVTYRGRYTPGSPGEGAQVEVLPFPALGLLRPYERVV